MLAVNQRLGCRAVSEGVLVEGPAQRARPARADV